MSFNLKNGNISFHCNFALQLASSTAANNLTAEGGTLLSAALVDAVQSDKRTGDLKESTFRGFSHRLTGYFSQTTYTAEKRQIDKHEESSVLGYAGRDDHPADGAR